MSSKNNGKYVSVGVLQYRSDLDDKKATARTYKPGDVIDEDLDQADVDRLLKRGAIKESKQAKLEEKARADAAAAAAQAQEAAAAAQAQEAADEAEAKAAALATGGDAAAQTEAQTMKPSVRGSNKR